MREPRIGDLVILKEFDQQKKSMGVIEYVGVDRIHQSYWIDFRIFWSDHYYVENYGTYRIPFSAASVGRIEVISNRDNAEHD